MDAYVAGIAYHLPSTVVSNAELHEQNPTWDMARLGPKVGILQRHIAAPDETASDLAFAAATRLLDGLSFDRSTIDMLLFCTQSPDYALPTTACVLQHRLGLPTTCGALDFNQGCSGYVYGLHLAKAMIAAGMAANVLLLTGETYSKLIHPQDRTVRPLFGDAASATLINANSEGARIGNFVLGTDGSGYANLIVPAGGARTPRTAETGVEKEDDGGSVRSEEHLYMNGPEILRFTVARIPSLIAKLLDAECLSQNQVDWFVFHQANAFMNSRLCTKLGIPKAKAPMYMEQWGNTVSSTIPIVLKEAGNGFQQGDKVMLIGFGVGYSWGACMLEWNRVALV